LQIVITQLVLELDVDKVLVELDKSGQIIEPPWVRVISTENRTDAVVPPPPSHVLKEELG
jgi:hypothetical protein